MNWSSATRNAATSRRATLPALAAAALLLLAAPDAGARRPAPTCAIGQYAVPSASAFLLPDTAGAPLYTTAVIEITGGQISIPGACQPTRVRLRRGAATVGVRARWAQCQSGVRRVGLRATIDAATCGTMTGTLRVGAPSRRLRFSVSRSPRVLVFSRTAGFRHPSIEDAKRVLGNLDPAEGIAPVFTEDPVVFTDDGLRDVDVVVFANTTGDVLDQTQQEALVRFVRSGRGYVGVHSAADTEHTWPWYGRLVGAYFINHPLLPVEVTVTREDRLHPSTAHLDASFTFTDEIYNFDRNPRHDHAILLTVDEAGFIFPNFPDGPSMGADHPIAWYKEFEGGRSFYTNLGHRPETWEDPRFQRHLLAGIRWAAEPPAYSRTVVTREARNPLALAVAPDGRVYYVERSGEVRLWEPRTGRVIEALRLEVDTTAENGLLGIALDPDFTNDRHVYLYHSVPVADEPPAGAPPGENVLSRFTAGPDGTLDPGTRIDLLRVPSERECCHEGGALAFAPDGTLFLSTGDNTDPFASEGAAPLDQRPGRERFNSQRTAQNPFDLRGKILRINRDGSIPSDNLFPPSGESGRPEIYVMGCRNPFRTAVDPVTGRLFWGEVGPDGFADNARGPRGYDEINVADTPGNYGWPYCIGDNLPYADWDFVTDTPRGLFSCSDMRPATLAYDYTTVSELALGNAASSEDIGFTGRTAIAGVFYRRPAGDAPWALPAPFTDVLLMTEWTRDIIAAVDVGPAGELRGVTRFLPWEKFRRPIDLDTSRDGALYVLEFGSEFFGDNSDAALTRIQYSPTGDLSPVAAIGATPVAGATPLAVEFSGEGSRAPARGDAVARYLWDLDGDGRIDRRGPRLRHTFRAPGVYPVTLTVVGRSGRRGVPAVQEIVVGNTPPRVMIESPADGATFPQGTRIQLRGSVFDDEDGVPPCEDLTWDIRLGHNAHSHPQRLADGCTVTLPASVPADHGGGGGLFLAVELRYTDRGGPGGTPPLTGRAGIRINVTRRPSE
jgi:glucose/arabinose dehydrogenase